MIKHIGKKVHIWPRNRHESINEHGQVTRDSFNVESGTSVLGTINGKPIVNQNEDGENFRMRSKSLDVEHTRKYLYDCEATYKIYNSILNDGE
jgi:hypothetical protein